MATSKLRFNQVFIFLMTLAAVSAFFVPPQYTNPIRAVFQNMFAPVAYPARALAARTIGKWRGSSANDEGADPSHPRTREQLVAENTQLRLSVASLTKQLADLQERDADRRQVGPVLALCRPFSVLGADPGPSESLAVGGTTLDGVQKGMPVLYPGGIAGRVDRAGVGGATVRLVTDAGFACTVSFARFKKDAQGEVTFVNLRTPATLLRGAGRGIMRISSLSTRDAQAAGIQVGDWVILNDPDWPQPLQGYRIGRITSKHNRLDAPLFVDLVVQPYGDLLALREVMVMVKDGN